MTCKSSGIIVRSRSSSPSEQGGTQVYPLPPRPSEAGARPVSSPSAAPAAASSGVSVLATIGVGGAAAPGGPPRPMALATSARLVNEPTRIFAIPQPLPGASDAKRTDEGGRRASTFASPPFSPVPNRKVVARPAARSGDASRPAAAKARPPHAPRLRAFDDGRNRVTTWWTAMTINAPLAQLAEGEAGNPKAAVAKARAPGASRRLTALVVAAATVVGAAALFVRVGPDRMGRRSGSSGATAPAGGAGAEAHAGAVAAAPPRPPSAVAPNDAPVEPRIALGVAVAPPPVVAQPVIAPIEAAPATAPRELARVKPSTLAGGGASPRATLARQAVDALLSGDRALALQHYRELSRNAPAHDAYREAVRLLDSSTTPP